MYRQTVKAHVNKQAPAYTGGMAKVYVHTEGMAVVKRHTLKASVQVMAESDGNACTVNTVYTDGHGQ